MLTCQALCHKKKSHINYITLKLFDLYFWCSYVWVQETVDFKVMPQLAGWM